MSAEEHERLVNVIRDLHARLRKEYLKGGDYKAVWKSHCSEQTSREQYAKAMVILASKFWASNNTRIEWCYNFCKKYFFGGGLENVLRREAAKKKTSLEPAAAENPSNCVIIPPFSGHINLLDVGSCYNPFAQFPELDCVAIDLTPAEKDVLECDFLNVEISKRDNLRRLLQKCPQFSDRKVNYLVQESFHVVVFSLVLEYLPSPAQRYAFCSNAWQLLQFNGVLLIITPDSKRQHRNAAMMKSWRTALEIIGFQRVAYEKQAHLHCMAFRKVSSVSCRMSTDGRNPEEMIYIPQDFNTCCDLEDPASEPSALGSLRTEEDEKLIVERFAELPFEVF